MNGDRCLTCGHPRIDHAGLMCLSREDAAVNGPCRCDGFVAEAPVGYLSLVAGLPAVPVYFGTSKVDPPGKEKNGG